jgi:hypothetical protein
MLGVRGCCVPSPAGRLAVPGVSPEDALALLLDGALDADRARPEEEWEALAGTRGAGRPNGWGASP